MKKLEEIDRLVEEAFEKSRIVGAINTDQQPYYIAILTSLARKCAEINEEDYHDCYNTPGNTVNNYNYRLRDGKVEEVKQEEKPALQPLPSEVPDWFITSWKNTSGDITMRIEEWHKIVDHFGTPPREWWMDLKEGDKFVDYSGNIRVFYDFLLEYKNDLGGYSRACARRSSPYTDPAQSFREKLTPKMQVEFDKIVSSLTPNTTQL